MANSAFTVTGTGGGGGAQTLIQTITVANQKTVSFTTGITNIYGSFVVRVANLICQSGDNALLMNFSTNGGVSYDNTSGHYQWLFTGSAPAAYLNRNSTPTTSFNIMGQVTPNYGIDSTYPASASIEIYNPLATTYVSYNAAVGYGLSAAIGGVVTGESSGYYNVSTGGVNAFQFSLANADNMISGVFTLYGVT